MTEVEKIETNKQEIEENSVKITNNKDSVAGNLVKKQKYLHMYMCLKVLSQEILKQG